MCNSVGRKLKQSVSFLVCTCCYLWASFKRYGLTIQFGNLYNWILCYLNQLSVLEGSRYSTACVRWSFVCFVFLFFLRLSLVRLSVLFVLCAFAKRMRCVEFGSFPFFTWLFEIFCSKVFTRLFVWYVYRFCVCFLIFSSLSHLTLGSCLLFNYLSSTLIALFPSFVFFSFKLHTLRLFFFLLLARSLLPTVSCFCCMAVR